MNFMFEWQERARTSETLFLPSVMFFLFINVLMTAFLIIF